MMRLSRMWESWTDGWPCTLSPLLSLRSDSTPARGFGEPAPVRDTCVHASPELAVLLLTRSSPCTSQTKSGGSRGPPPSPRDSHPAALETSTLDADVFAAFTQAPSLLLGHLAIPPQFMSTGASERDLIWKQGLFICHQVKWGHLSLGTPNVIQLVSLCKEGSVDPDSQGEGGTDWSDVSAAEGLGPPQPAAGGDRMDPPQGLRLERAADTRPPHVPSPELRGDTLLFEAARFVLLCHRSLKD